MHGEWPRGDVHGAACAGCSEGDASEVQCQRRAAVHCSCRVIDAQNTHTRVAPRGARVPIRQALLEVGERSPAAHLQAHGEVASERAHVYLAAEPVVQCHEHVRRAARGDAPTAAAGAGEGRRVRAHVTGQGAAAHVDGYR